MFGQRDVGDWLECVWKGQLVFSGLSTWGRWLWDEGCPGEPGYSVIKKFWVLSFESEHWLFFPSILLIMLFGFVLHRPACKKKILLGVLSKKVLRGCLTLLCNGLEDTVQHLSYILTGILKVQTFVCISFKVHLAFGQFTNILKHMLLWLHK